jgi:hypothetical protein
MSFEVKIFVALAPVCLVGTVYALSKGDWTAGIFALLLVLMAVLFRSEKGGFSRS